MIVDGKLSVLLIRYWRDEGLTAVRFPGGFKSLQGLEERGEAECGVGAFVGVGSGGSGGNSVGWGRCHDS